MDGSGGMKRTILVAEDEPDIRRLVRTFLEAQGYRVVEAADGALAVEAALRERPDLIMMDLNMPVLDGFEAAKRIRQHPALHDVPIVANSAFGDYGISFSLRDEELGTGFTYYLTKPIELDELKEILDQVVGS